MDALECLHTRNSVALLQAPAPNEDELAHILNAAMRASDHHRCRPWRFIIVRNNGRKILGKIFADVFSAEEPNADPAAVEKMAACTLRAPLIVIVVARIEHRDDVPDIEQHLSAGAATQLITLAAHALGFGAIWRTGAMAYRPAVYQALGLEPNELIVGFVYIGTAKAVKPLAQIDYREFVEFMD